jgi:hypothetical protein
MIDPDFHIAIRRINSDAPGIAEPNIDFRGTKPSRIREQIRLNVPGSERYAASMEFYNRGPGIGLDGIIGQNISRVSRHKPKANVLIASGIDLKARLSGIDEHELL